MSRNIFDHLLQRTSTMLVKGNVDHLRRRILDKTGALAVVGELEEFLA